MEFRSLKLQYQYLQQDIDYAIAEVISEANFISGRQVEQLEQELAEYVGVNYCVTCGNGTDALSLALMAWNIGPGDAIFVPDFTFFASGEVVSFEGGHPIFVDVNEDTYNIDPKRLEIEIQNVIAKKEYTPKAIIAVDLFGQPAAYPELRSIADKYGLKILEDGAQGFGGSIGGKRACSFGDLSTTSFFPMKPLGCYGDGGAIFTNDKEVAVLLRSLRVHGKGSYKYDNIRIGVNSRLDTIQAAILLAKLPSFKKNELSHINDTAKLYESELLDIVKVPIVKNGYVSSWAQYTIQLNDEVTRNGLQNYLREFNIPSMIYYPKPMHEQLAFAPYTENIGSLKITEQLCRTVLSLPIHPYMREYEVKEVTCRIREYMEKNK